MKNKHNILVGLTTATKEGWQSKIKEINELGIKELALFATYPDFEARKELYAELEKTSLERIPHVHLRSDYNESEMDYLVKRYGTKVFNIHPEWRAGHFLYSEKYKNNIFIENPKRIESVFWEMVHESGGICLDFAHWEDNGVIQGRYGYSDFENNLKKFKIGCCHISAIRKNDIPEKQICQLSGEKTLHYSFHTMKNLSDLDYLKSYLSYLPCYMSLELENSFKEQLEAKSYLEKLIDNEK